MSLNARKKLLCRFKRCLEINPNHASAHHNCANSLRDLKEIDDALVHYSKIVGVGISKSRYALQLGLALQLQETLGPGY